MTGGVIAGGAIAGGAMTGGATFPAGEGPLAAVPPCCTARKEPDLVLTAENQRLPGQLQTPISNSSKRINRSQRLRSLLQPMGIPLSRRASIAIQDSPLSGSDT
jgi:hypothetical protein